MLLVMTSKQVPTSASTAAQSNGCPVKASARMATLVEMDRKMFSMIFQVVFFASLIALGML